MKILLIEDDYGCRLAIEAYLRDKIPQVAFEFTSAETLLDGLKVARNADAVILDLTLRDSRDPAETVNAYTPLFREVPTVIVSGQDQLPCVMAALENGARSFICKPKLEGMTEAFTEIVKSHNAKRGR